MLKPKRDKDQYKINKSPSNVASSSSYHVNQCPLKIYPSDLKIMASPCEPPVNVAAPAPGVVPGRGPMRMPRRQRWVPTGILAKRDEVVLPVAPPPQYQVSASAISYRIQSH